MQTGPRAYYPAYELNAYTNQPNRMAMVYSRLHETIQDRINEAGVEILSPAYNALRDGNMSTIPAPHAPPEPTSAFRVADVTRSAPDGAGSGAGNGAA